MRIRQGKQKGFTLIELLVVISIIGILIGLLVPAVLKVRSTANRIACANNLKNLGLACLNYATDKKGLPPALYTGYVAGKPAKGWGTIILSYIEQDNLYASYDLSQPFTDAVTLPINNQTVVTTIVNTFTCPSAPAARVYIFLLPVGAYSPPVSATTTQWQAASSDYGPILGVDSNLMGIQNPGSYNRGLVPWAGVNVTTVNTTPVTTNLDDPIENDLFSHCYPIGGNPAGTSVEPFLAPIGQGALSPDKQTKLDDIRDGTSNTIMLAEIAARPSLYQKNVKRPDVIPLRSNFLGQTSVGGGWGDSTTGAFILLGSDPNGNHLSPLPLPSGNNSCLINCSNELGLYSFHTGGAQVVFCDGSVHFLGKEASPQTVIALITRGGTETIQEDF
ncbi:MAG: DUF1559 domain-containing protein [Gemmataceae bacterium]